jgi:hypothetical protein
MFIEVVEHNTEKVGSMPIVDVSIEIGKGWVNEPYKEVQSDH